MPADPTAADPGETILFECKQSRSDLLRDTADEAATCARLATIATRRTELETLVGAHLPHLRRGETLFAECDAYDLDAVRHDGLREVRREEARLQAKLFAGTKFDRLRRYGCVDRLYLVVAENVMRAHEAPAGWGVLQAAGDKLELIRRPGRCDSGPVARRAMLRAIATAATRLVNRTFGISWEEIATTRASLPPE